MGSMRLRSSWKAPHSPSRSTSCVANGCACSSVWVHPRRHAWNPSTWSLTATCSARTSSPCGRLTGAMAWRSSGCTASPTTIWGSCWASSRASWPRSAKLQKPATSSGPSRSKTSRTEHVLPWLAPWRYAVEKHARTDYYRGVGTFVFGLAACYAERFGIRFDEEACAFKRRK